LAKHISSKQTEKCGFYQEGNQLKEIFALAFVIVTQTRCAGSLHDISHA